MVRMWVGYEFDRKHPKESDSYGNADHKFGSKYLFHSTPSLSI
jgi:hypothetical protein